MTRGWRAVLAAGGVVYALFLAALAAGYWIGFRQSARGAGSPAAAELAATEPARLDARVRALQRRLAARTPRGLYIVIDTGANRLFLKRGEEVLRAVVVSTGSGVILQEPGGSERSWVFDTPRGAFAVKSKIANPYWIKPDWAFIEEGEPIPRRAEDRVESGTLGEYALGFGSGYFLHGTLYTRMLGRSVTHGCVRMGDEDLEFIFRRVSIGTPIYIY